MHNKYYRTLQNLAFISGFAGLLIIGISITSTGCTYSSEHTQESTTASIEPVSITTAADALDKGIEAHGGLEKWSSFGALEYTVARGERSEHHLIDLHSRKTLQTGDSFQIGYDGTQVWITPGLDAYSGTPRFVNGLDFYFFAIPFVLGDPGTNREYLGRVQINDKEYEAVKVSYDAGTGASPDDYYIVHFDPETFQLEVLLYTATFYSQTPSESYNARVYEEWKDVEGLLLPTKIVSYKWDAEQRQLGEARGETMYKDITLSTQSPAPSVFAAPPDAEIDEE